MAEQSLAPSLLLTRPAGQGVRFAAQVAARFGVVRTVESPLLAPEFPSVSLPAEAPAGLIFTSETGVEAARRLGLSRVPAYCVGPRTAAAAAQAGFAATAMQGDAEGLVDGLLARRPRGLLLHLHGADTRGDVAARLRAAGLSASGLEVYAQRAQPLTDEARGLIRGDAPVVVPLFSPRSAALFSAEAGGATAPLWVAALSLAVAAEVSVPCARTVVSRAPEAEAMLESLAAFLPPRRGA